MDILEQLDNVWNGFDDLYEIDEQTTCRKYYVEENGNKTYFEFDFSGLKKAQMLCVKLCKKYDVEQWKIKVDDGNKIL